MSSVLGWEITKLVNSVDRVPSGFELRSGFQQFHRRILDLNSGLDFNSFTGASTVVGQLVLLFLFLIQRETALRCPPPRGDIPDTLSAGKSGISVDRVPSG
eukprot:TRINITY_DN20031_c0_g1_i1.p1 TRINITY_DN20031_c0_g1~~TRINITY_DN20031_c0_g1_i1.p1  ORF type:complete len:101 (+),score=3.17 TRINITY_DN20031_c0_g1_i1:61-363(+)